MPVKLLNRNKWISVTLKGLETVNRHT